MKRPITVVLLAFLALVAGVLAIVDSLSYLGIRPIATLGPIEFLGYNWLGAGLAGFAALIWFWTGWGLWKMEQQAWLFVVVMAIFYLFFDLVALIGDNSIQSILPQMMVSGLALLLAMLPGVQKAFGR
jgi:hypothetical protein